MNEYPTPTGKNPTITAFESYAAENGDQKALVSENRTLTYSQLNQRAQNLANLLQSCSVQLNEPVPALLDNDIERTIALLGIHLAGKVYLPLDPRNPEARLGLMLGSAQPMSFVVNKHTATLARRLVSGNQPLIYLDDINGTITQSETVQFYDPLALAWILFTSGSSGKPKGVQQTYQNCAIYTRQVIETLGLQPGERFAIASPLTSHAGVVVTMGVLSSGGTLYMMEPGENSAEVILAWLADKCITVLLIAPTLFRRMVDNPEMKNQLHSLRVLRLTGEPVTKYDFDLFNKHCQPDCILSIGYGATETGGISHAFFEHPASPDNGRISVGFPRQEVEIRIIDEQEQPVAIDKPGEIVVESRYFSPGYWNMPDLTNQVFSDSTDGKRRYRTGDLGILHQDGSLEHIGRKDSQVKIHGQRVEISEIEASLRSIECVKEAAVHSNKSDSGEWRLEAFVDVKVPSETNSHEIREALTNRLPVFMLPHSITILESLPLTRTGEIDRSALDEFATGGDKQAVSFIAPQSLTEQLIADIWSDVLSIERVGRHTEFLALNGDSLSALRIIYQIDQEFHIELSIQEFIAHPTITKQAHLIEVKMGDNQ